MQCYSGGCVLAERAWLNLPCLCSFDLACPMLIILPCPSVPLTQTCCLQVPIGIKAVVFTTYALRGHALLPDVVFPALALLDQLSLPLFFLPDQIGAVVQGRVSLRRLQAFWEQPEMQQAPCLPAAPPGEAAVVVRQGVFAWAPGECDGLMGLGSFHVNGTRGTQLHGCPCATEKWQRLGCCSRQIAISNGLLWQRQAQCRSLSALFTDGHGSTSRSRIIKSLAVAIVSAFGHACHQPRCS